MTTENTREVSAGTLLVRVVESGAGCVITLRGELDLANASAVEDELDAALAKEAAVTVDLCELEFIDSTGIALLVRAMGRNSDAAELRFVPSEFSAVNKVLELTGVHERMELVERPAPAPSQSS
jgi:anti-sigma B factor antagonist